MSFEKEMVGYLSFQDSLWDHFIEINIKCLVKYVNLKRHSCLPLYDLHYHFNMCVTDGAL